MRFATSGELAEGAEQPQEKLEGAVLPRENLRREQSSLGKTCRGSRAASGELAEGAVLPRENMQREQSCLVELAEGAELPRENLRRELQPREN